MANLGALYLVDSEVGKILYELDKNTACDVILHNDAFADNIKEIYEVPIQENLSERFMVLRSPCEVEKLFSILRISNMQIRDWEKVFSEILKTIKEKGYYLICHY